jgi:hypothetical protein
MTDKKVAALSDARLRGIRPDGELVATTFVKSL